MTLRDDGSYNLIVISDVHLGSDLVHHSRPDAPLRARASERRDAELIALLSWYRDRKKGGRPWRLVIAGDFIDFVGMSVSPPVEGLRTLLSEDEASFGLGGAADHTVYKLRQVAWHHRDVIRSLARFVEAGNALVVLRGNHDVDFHWKPVQDEFLRQLSFHARFERGLVEFSEWFYYEEGRVYIEHGHQYDTYCAHECLLSPVQPSDPKRSFRTLSDILLSRVVRPTRGMSESGHEGATIWDYLRFAFGLGYHGALDLARRFVLAVTALVVSWKDHMSHGARRLREHHERRMADLAARTGLGLDRLRALSSLHAAPVTRSLSMLLSAVLLDRILLFAAGCLVASVVVVAAPSALTAFFATLAVFGVLAVLGVVWARSRAAIDPSSELRDRAARVARVFPAAFVVMGHTHLPEVRSAAGSGCTYVNLGAWAEDEVPDGHRPALPASRTHLVLVQGEEQAVAELMVWDSRLGPQKFISGYRA